MNRILTVIFLLFVWWMPLHAQDIEYVWVRGRVLEQQNQSPLPGANVFLTGSTLGAATLNDGSFEFRVPGRMLSYEITVSMVGFNTESRVLNETDIANTTLRFELVPATYLLEEVTITESNAEWLSTLARFERLVFSTTDNSKDCTILNPEKLSLVYDNVDREISATSREPFRFENKALGYLVELHQPKFFGSETTVMWEGNLHFEELAPQNESEEQKWVANRRDAYNGSVRQFLVALARGETNKKGFFVATTERPGYSIEHKVAPNPDKYVTVEFADPTIPTWRIYFPRTLAISYQLESESMAYRLYQDQMGLRERDEMEFQTGRLRERRTQNSWLSLNGDYAIIDQYGNEYGAYLLKRFGYWEWERLCEILPSDFSLN